MTTPNDTWQEVQLGDLFQVKHGYAFKGEHFTNKGELVVLTPGNFEAMGGLKLKGDKEKFYASDFPDEFLLEAGELLIVMTDLIQDAPILGSPAIISESGRFLHNQRLGKVTNLQTKSVTKEFIYHLMNFYEVRGQIRGSATGSTVKHTSPSRIYEVKVSIPPLETQRQIAEILSAYDDLIENNSRRIKVLEEMAGLVFREWFVNFRFPGHEGVRRVDSELGEIPEGWRAAKLGDIAEQVRRNVQPSEVSKETPYIGLEHLPRKSIALSEWAFPDSVTSSKLRFYQGEILFGKIRPYFHKVGVAPVDGICSSDIIVIRPKNSEFAAFTVMVTSSEDFVLQSVQTSQGTKMPRANWDVLIKYPVFLPDSALLERFNGIAANIISQIRTFVFKNQNLRRTRDLLLPKLISGELGVSQLGADPEDVQDLADLRAAKAAEGDSLTITLDELKTELGQA